MNLKKCTFFPFTSTRKHLQKFCLIGLEFQFYCIRSISCELLCMARDINMKNRLHDQSNSLSPQCIKLTWCITHSRFSCFHICLTPYTIQILSCLKHHLFVCSIFLSFYYFYYYLSFFTDKFSTKMYCLLIANI